MGRAAKENCRRRSSSCGGRSSARQQERQCSNSRNSPGARTISSRRRSPTWRTPEKAAELQTARARRAQGLGFRRNGTGAIVERAEGSSLRDHRVQLLIRDATLWRDAQAKAKAAAAKPFPPVQRPGVAQPKAPRRMHRSRTSPSNSRTPAASSVTGRGRLLKAKRACATRLERNYQCLSQHQLSRPTRQSVTAKTSRI